MPELVQVNEDVYYLSDHMNYGVIRVGGDRCVIIDSGVDEKAGQMILAALAAEKLELLGIINTHSHADHYGANQYLVGQTGAKVYAPTLEAAIMQNPSLEPLYLYGANPPVALTGRNMMGVVSPVDVLLDGPTVTIGEKELTIIALPGHSPNQIGVIADDVFFCGDAIFSEKAWERLVIIYAINIGQMADSIERLLTVRAKSFVPSHATPSGSIDELAQFNLTRIQALADDILKILATPAEASTVLWEVCHRYGLSMKTIVQYYLSLDTVKAYLSYLLEKELVTYRFEANRLMWKAI